MFSVNGNGSNKAAGRVQSACLVCWLILIDGGVDAFRLAVVRLIYSLHVAVDSTLCLYASDDFFATIYFC